MIIDYKGIFNAIVLNLAARNIKAYDLSKKDAFPQQKNLTILLMDSLILLCMLYDIIANHKQNHARKKKRKRKKTYKQTLIGYIT